MPLIKNNPKNSDEEYVMTDSSEDDFDSNKISWRVQKEDEDSEDEVLGVGDSESETDDDTKDEIEMNESDIEGLGSDDNLPNERAWGKKKKTFYNTDYIDQDYGGWKDDAEEAEKEEEEARKLQQHFTSQLDDVNFDLDMFKEVEEPQKILAKETIKTDLSNMSKEQKEALFKKESPEFDGLVKDFKDYWKELEKIKPIILLIQENKLPPSTGSQYILIKNQLILNYCTNISFYLMLKAKRIKIQNHPIAKRLFQCKQLLKQMDKTETMYNEIDNLLVLIENQTLEDVIEKQKSSNKTKKKSKVKNSTKLKLLRMPFKNEINIPKEKRLLELPEEDSFISKKKKVEFKEEIKEEFVFEENKSEEDIDDEGDPLSKRAITKQIEKNRGLTPYRKKELRNPRVKHRNKYRRALIRRKGMVREVRKELSKYSGESSGIKANISKSIKIQ